MKSEIEFLRGSSHRKDMTGLNYRFGFKLLRLHTRGIRERVSKKLGQPTMLEKSEANDDSSSAQWMIRSEGTK